MTAERKRRRAEETARVSARAGADRRVREVGRGGRGRRARDRRARALGAREHGRAGRSCGTGHVDGEAEGVRLLLRLRLRQGNERPVPARVRVAIKEIGKRPGLRLCCAHVSREPRHPPQARVRAEPQGPRRRPRRSPRSSGSSAARGRHRHRRASHFGRGRRRGRARSLERPCLHLRAREGECLRLRQQRERLAGVALGRQCGVSPFQVKTCFPPQNLTC